MRGRWGYIVLLWVSVASGAWADEASSVGKVSALAGVAWRTPAGGERVSLATGADVRLGDLIHIDTGNLKITLNDGTAICLGAQDGKGQEPGAELRIDEASFKEQVREGFRATLMFGKIWSKVKKAAAGSNAKFEVTTDRAVAGVRGTVFRVDAIKLTLTATAPVTRVRVDEGKVGVEAKAKKKAPKAGGPRHQVAGPQEVSKDEWEKRFTELQKGMQIEITEELTENEPFRGQPIRPSQWSDAFARFVAETSP